VLAPRRARSRACSPCEAAPLTNLRHEPVAVDDADRRLLPLLDDARLREEIAAQAWDGQPAGDEAGKLDQALARLARQAFLVQ
jgi:hypothetical protein